MLACIRPRGRAPGRREAANLLHRLVREAAASASVAHDRARHPFAEFVAQILLVARELGLLCSRRAGQQKADREAHIFFSQPALAAGLGGAVKVRGILAQLLEPLLNRADANVGAGQAYQLSIWG